MLKSKGEAYNLLIEDSFVVHMDEDMYINTNNGVLNKEVIHKRKEKILNKGTKYLVDELVSIKQGYPKGDLSEVNINTDFRILDNKTFNKLIKFLDNE